MAIHRTCIESKTHSVLLSIRFTFSSSFELEPCMLRFSSLCLYYVCVSCMNMNCMYRSLLLFVCCFFFSSLVYLTRNICVRNAQKHSQCERNRVRSARNFVYKSKWRNKREKTEKWKEEDDMYVVLCIEAQRLHDGTDRKNRVASNILTKKQQPTHKTKRKKASRKVRRERKTENNNNK